MNTQPEKSLNLMIWKPEYECIIKIINCQHRDTLIYLNRWFSDIKLKRIDLKNPVKYITEKLRYLKHFCDQHLSFEEDVLTILCVDYGFDSTLFASHVKSHRQFSDSLLKVLSEQVDHFIKSGNVTILEDLIVESLRDVAKWWFHHITNDDRKGQECYDYKYQLFMKNLSMEKQINLLNDILTKAELVA